MALKERLELRQQKARLCTTPPDPVADCVSVWSISNRGSTTQAARYPEARPRFKSGVRFAYLTRALEIKGAVPAASAYDYADLS